MTLSVLDLSPVSDGSTGAEALRNTLDLARLADELGYHRYWLAEHHNSSFTASPIPEIMIAKVADVTSRIRVGSGGVMLPNRNPLLVAEAFNVLSTLHPGRIDLGIGRAPGTDQLTAFALRRSKEAVMAEDFPEQLGETLAFLINQFPTDHPFQRVKAIPLDAPTPEVWLLGSSDYSAHLAARLGLGFAFAHHISPGPAVASLRAYREEFRPSGFFTEPQAMLATSVLCAETDEEAEELARSYDLAILRLHQGRFGKFPSIEEAAAYPYSEAEREQVRQNRSRITVGSPDTVRDRLTKLAEAAGVEEIMATTMVHSHAARRRSYELLIGAFS
ncbi:LLM class flavin-dependent oxidoreductase [Fimbriimonas ginsengisoli]|uniref:Luciferase-like protein n=1 Tax=Fimbriimonas ginsengisoli Gsoil 348 TaxID=661478 RepID=A0A068NPF5_FIMGI|nr:LLM class flavin-dependent oxidoreductase [Fimbriimonas ginsengisoli]AIE85331.1 luciferase-like protein [Fimbriimonas ginsengisoli Gsoil 348]